MSSFEETTDLRSSVPGMDGAGVASPVAGWEEGADAMIVALMPRLQKALTKAAELLYEEVLDTAEGYLKDNVRYNVQSAINAADRQALTDRRHLLDCERHRQDLFWDLKDLVRVVRQEEQAGTTSIRLRECADKAEKRLTASLDQSASASTSGIGAADKPNPQPKGGETNG